MTTKNLIPTADCIKGRVYRLKARKLKYGIYDGEQGFIGIRTLFSRSYLVLEMHSDVGEPVGTVSEQIDTGIDAPSDVIIDTILGSYDQLTGRDLVYDPDMAPPIKRSLSTTGWWKYKDTGEAYPSGRGTATRWNSKLFSFMASIPSMVEQDKLWKAESFPTTVLAFNDLPDNDHD